MKTIFTSLITTMAMFILLGCSSKDASSYYILHNLAKEECNKNPNLDERQQCITEHSKAFDSNKYQKTNQ